MNLLSLIIIFLALLVCGSIAYIAWELTSERRMKKGGSAGRQSPPVNRSIDSDNNAD